MTPEVVSGALDQITHRAERVDIIPPIPKVATHWQNNLVLAAARAGDADDLVPGDAELLALGAYGSISIVSVSDFVAILGANGPED